MKKFLLIGISSLFLLTGCNSNKIVCTEKIDENGINSELIVTASLNKNRVDKISATMTFENKAMADQVCGIFEKTNTFAEQESDMINLDCKDNVITFDDYSKLLNNDEEKVIGMKKADFIKMMEKNKGVSCK